MLSASQPTLPTGKTTTSSTRRSSDLGGTGPYTFAVTAGALPNGITLDGTTGVLSGTPTQTGPFSFTITAKDVNNCTGNTTYRITISCGASTVYPAYLPNGNTSTYYRL